MKTLIILRGISGSGKSSFSKLLSNLDGSVVCNADNFFINERGEYLFDREKLSFAHSYCRDAFDRAIQDETVKVIILDNTNCKPSDYKYYVDQAKRYGLRVVFTVLEKRHENENVHNVPEASLEKQYNNLTKDLKLK